MFRDRILEVHRNIFDLVGVLFALVA